MNTSMISIVNRQLRAGCFVTALALNLLLIHPVSAQTWVSDVPLQKARWNHTATLLPNRLVLIAGGEIFNDNTNGFFQGTNSAELYNSVTGASSLTAPMHDSHWGGSATLLTNGLVLVVGGRKNNGSVIATAELYDPISMTWSNTGSMPQERCDFTTTLLPNDKVLVVAGQNGSAVDQSSAELYDPVSGTWSSTNSVNYATDSATAVLLPNGKVLFCGGGDGQGGALTNAVLYNPATGIWTNTGPMHTARGGHVATLLPDGEVLVVGGAGDNSAELYNPTNGTWSFAASMNDGRSFPTAALLPNGQVLVIGGDPGQTDTELYDPTNNTWTFAASMHVGRLSNTETSLGDGEVVVAGGDTSDFNGPAIASVETYAGHQVQLTHNLVAHYPFDDALDGSPFDSQLLEDTSGNGNDIDPDSISSSDDPPTIISNNVAGGSAIQFDGNNFYELPSALLTTIADSYSISLWLQTTQNFGDDTGDNDDGPASPGIIWAGGGSDNDFDSEPMTLTGSKLGFYTGDDQATLHSATSINSGDFTHIVVTRDQTTGTKKIYINGVLDATTTGETNFLTNSTDLLLGAGFFNGGITGVVDDVQFYSGVLNDDEVTFLFANPGSVAPAGQAIVPIDVAVDATNLSWTTFGDANWSGQTGVSHDGDGSDQSGSMSDNQSSTLQATVTGPGTLTFWWQTVCANDNFELDFDIDGGFKAELFDQQAWTMQTFHIDSGVHTLTWVASTSDGSSPDDAGYVDQVTFTPLPSPGMWTRTGSLTNTASEQTATLLPNGKVLVTGGLDTNNNAVASAQLYDPATGIWTGTRSMNSARFSHTAILLTNGLVLVAGGCDGSSALDTAELYNPATGTWTVTGPMHTARYTHTATLLPNGKVLVAGGQSTNAFPNITASAEIYDPVNGTWTAANPMLIQRNSQTATLLPNGQVLIAGGEVTNFTMVTGESELFNPTNGTWTQTGFMTGPFAFHTATLLTNGQVLVAGGDIDEGFGFGGVDLIPDSEAQLYDPNSGIWTATTSMNFVHDHHTATLLTNGLVLVAGGGTSFGSSTNSELYDPVAQIWTQAASMIAPRQSHTATLLLNGLVLATGGQNFGTSLASAELYSSVISVQISLVNPIRPTGGAFQFSWTNTPGSANIVLSTTNLITPLVNWITNGGGTEISPGQFQFTDLQATNRQQFYRVRSP
jgi:hypothetical protein